MIDVVAPTLSFQGLPVGAITAVHGSPLYLYDADVLTGRYDAVRDRLHEAVSIYYSLKANPNMAICALLGRRGAGAEVSSLAELRTAQRAGIPTDRTIFLGPGKSRAEIEACCAAGIRALIVESLPELALVDDVCRRAGRSLDVLLRINPGFRSARSGLTMAGTARQFGIDQAVVAGREDLNTRYDAIRIRGVHVYMGTRILSAEAIVDNTARILSMAEQLSDRCGFPLDIVDVGGGIGVAYHDNERDLDLSAVTDGINAAVTTFVANHPGTKVITELGRYLVADCGTYITTVRYIKESFGERFAVADGGTNHHMAAVGIGSVVKRNFPISLLGRVSAAEDVPWQVTGPLCTPNDTIGRRVPLPADLAPGDLIGVHRAGAYGPSASPVYFLSHGYPAEVLIHRGRTHVVRRRDSVDDLLAPQFLPDFDQI
ncbi:alanine racemase [Micromonospora sp. NPDC050686]|uniref:alanine racemase n=1 Tax=Micromonospora sp. NPDC050686 TaxID=3154631 RepID=UPI0033E47EAF